MVLRFVVLESSILFNKAKLDDYMEIDLEFDRDDKCVPLDRRPHISLLLGAGFSVPAGYPTSIQLGEKLLSLNGIGFTVDGNIVDEEESKRTQMVFNPFELAFLFCKEIMGVYADNNNGVLDYESFYDFINIGDGINGEPYLTIGKKYTNPSFSFNYGQLVSKLLTVFNCIISYLLKDSSGRNNYENMPYQIGTVEGYSGFLKYLSSKKETSIINVHTLNHDLFFDYLNKTELLAGAVSDGFDEFGSPYFGVLTTGDKCILERFTNRYDSAIRLYKLHGSLDYVLFRKSTKNGYLIADNYVKIKQSTGMEPILKSRGRKMYYDEYHFAYHSDFLTGSTSKILRYDDSLMYKKLFKHFKRNLRKSEELILIGYRCKDLEINKMIKDNFEYTSKKIIIVDPFAGDAVKSFAKRCNAFIANTTLEEFSINEYGS